MSNQNDDDLISGINITPLVDVFLVILIIFLVSAPVIYQSAMKVQLPTAANGDPSETSPLQFSLTAAGDVSWGKELLSWDTLNNKLNEVAEKHRDQVAIINADTHTDHGVVIRLMDTLRQHGLTRFAMSVEPGSAQ